MTFLAYRSGFESADLAKGVSPDGVGFGRGKGGLTVFTRRETRVLFLRPAQGIPLVRTPGRFILGGQPSPYRERRSGGGGHGRDDKKAKPRAFPVVLVPAEVPVSVDPARTQASPPPEKPTARIQARGKSQSENPVNVDAVDRLNRTLEQKQNQRPKVQEDSIDPVRRQRRDEEELVSVLIELFKA